MCSSLARTPCTRSNVESTVPLAAAHCPQLTGLARLGGTLWLDSHGLLARAAIITALSREA